MQYASQFGDTSAVSMVFPSGFGSVVVLAGVSVSGVPRGFPSPGSKLTQETEGISSSREDLGSYSSGFLTSLWKLDEELVFEVQVTEKCVSIFFYVVVPSRNPKDGTKRALYAVQGIRGGIVGAYGKNVEVTILNRGELLRAVNSSLGGVRTSQMKVVKNGEGSYGLDGAVAKSVTVERTGNYSGVASDVVRYVGVLELAKGLPALKANDRENQISRMIDSFLSLDMSNASLVVNLKPHKVSFLRKHAARGKARTLIPNMDLKDRLRSYQDFLGGEKTVRELDEIRYGEWSGYWKVSAHIIIDSKSALGVAKDLGMSKASLTSIFSDPHFTIEFKALKGRELIRALRSLPVRRLQSSRPIEMSSVRLSALVHIPTKAYPGIDRKELPEFEVPKSLDDSETGKLVLGNLVHGDNELYPVGIEVNDLTLNMVVVGHIGSGKTMFVSQLLLDLWDVDPTIGWVIFDVKGEYAPVATHLPDSVDVYRPGDESSPLRLNIFDPGVDNSENHALKLFAMLRDALSSLFEESAELSPQMERLCREALVKTVADPKRRSFKGFYQSLEDQARIIQPNAPTIMSSLEAIKNRVEKFRHGVLRNVFDAGSTNLNFTAITEKKIIIDLSFLLGHGDTKDDVRLLMNVVLKNVFDVVMKLGLSRTLRHIVVVEEAGLLVPEIFSRKTSSETTPAEDIVLVERALGEGMILVSPRPTISENILANSGTKVIFKCPYDSKRVARFLNLNKQQEQYLKVLPKREAIVTIPDYQYPFRIKTLESEISDLSLQPNLEATATTAITNQRGDSLIEGEYDGIDDEGEDTTNTQNAHTVGREGNCVHDSASVRHGDAVEKDVVNRLLRKDENSDRYKVFRAIALKYPQRVEATTIVKNELKGDWRRLLDALRNLTDSELWKGPLIDANLKEEQGEQQQEEDVTFGLTEYGWRVWITIMSRA